MKIPLSNPIAKLTLIFFALLLPVFTTGHAEPPPAAPPGAPANPGRFQQGQQRQMSKPEWVDPNHDSIGDTQYKTFQSKVLGHEVSYMISLPAGYDKDTKRYPVIYWLHGMGGNQRGGATMYIPHVQEAVKGGIVSPVIIVLVNGMVTSFYCDSEDGQVPMESVIIKDLIPHIDQTYRTIAKREDRIIEGFSMGGYGAAHLGFKYPELFGTVVINAGALVDTNLPIMERVFGNNNQRALAEHPMQLARANADKLRGQTHIRIGVGSIDGLLPKNKALHDLLDELHIANEFEIVPNIGHDSPHYYQLLGPKVFAFHQKSLGTPAVAGN